MSIPGFDAIGRLALGQISEGSQQTLAVASQWSANNVPIKYAARDFYGFVNAPDNPNQFFGNDFSWWPQAPRPINFSKDWVAYCEAGFTIVPVSQIGIEFTPFSPPPPPPRYARDWIAFSGNLSFEFPVYTEPFSPFDIGRHARNSAVDWITQFGNISVDTLPNDPIPFTIFDAAPHPRNFSRDWVANTGIGFSFTPVSQIGIDFTPFSDGRHASNFSRDWVAYSGNVLVEAPPLVNVNFTPFSVGLTAKLWTRFGQQPQWWTYEFKVPPKPRLDRGGLGDWIPRHRHPSVYSQEYYDLLKKKIDDGDEDKLEELIEEIKRVVPNLLIPISRLIPGVTLPSLLQAPPFRPMPSLTTNPPAFRMALPHEIAADDEAVIVMILAEE
jgi:hypothetical protein